MSAPKRFFPRLFIPGLTVEIYVINLLRESYLAKRNTRAAVFIGFTINIYQNLLHRPFSFYVVVTYRVSCDRYFSRRKLSDKPHTDRKRSGQYVRTYTYIPISVSIKIFGAINQLLSRLATRDSLLRRVGLVGQNEKEKKKRERTYVISSLRPNAFSVSARTLSALLQPPIKCGD